MDFRVKYFDETKPFSEEKPKIIGFLSTDGNGESRADLSQIKYYIPPNEDKVYLDLNIGYENVIKKICKPSNDIDDVLHWINSHSDVVSSSEPDFISMRGVISTLLFTIPSLSNRNDDGWIICAEKFKGKIYLCAYMTEEKKRFEGNKNEKEKRGECWGYKFEQYMVRDDPAKPPDTSKPVDENEEFCLFYSKKIGKHSLLYAGEIDGIYSKKIITEKSILSEEIKLVELKTNKIMSYRANKFFFHLKLVRAWCQSILSCVENVVIGFRTEDGIVEKIQRYSMADILEETEKILKPVVAKNFCNAFLDHVKRVVTEDRDKYIYKFTWDPKTCAHIKGEKLLNKNNQSEYSFLPKWYTDNC